MVELAEKPRVHAPDETDSLPAQLVVLGYSTSDTFLAGGGADQPWILLSASKVRGIACVQEGSAMAPGFGDGTADFPVQRGGDIIAADASKYVKGGSKLVDGAGSVLRGVPYPGTAATVVSEGIDYASGTDTAGEAAMDAGAGLSGAAVGALPVPRSARRSSRVLAPWSVGLSGAWPGISSRPRRKVC
ncbi:hypothetical protein SAMN04487905_101510 [Actinopolyspora xinjiangensis]|uniref:Uncharacterized protein n=1 Tax=Actinopolyspora xinjiangensis TaxID=405564 RepID=A0A1H0PEV0_9ACTN|nr:hypothetical protein [Actinopolyspora xinjiangensis]SDP03280.1 hypothetical protein SAMN04487905_101510 [Actinopolyspora xinjiangensis]